MTKKSAPKTGSFFRLLRPGRKALAVIFLVMFIVGYWTASTAAISVPVVMPTSCAMGCVYGVCPCDLFGTTYTIANTLINLLRTYLRTSARAVEQFVGTQTDTLVEALLERINDAEKSMIDWWKGMWSKDLLPSMQKMTQQLNVAAADQSRTLQSVVDAGNLAENRLVRQNDEIENHRAMRSSENVCASATVAGGYGRATNLARALRNAWEKESLAIGLAGKGSSGAVAAAGAQRRRYDEYRNTFCDPSGNGGQNDCGASDPAYYNADTQPSKFIYNRLTTDVTEPKMAKTVETITNNMVGVAAADPIPLGALQSAPGQATFLSRRSYLARYAAIRSVPQLVSGWRMPGSQMGDWVKSLREGAGVPLAEISANPSYREVMHASSVDRFNSGHYAVGMIAGESEIEMEKLTLDVFYLMQLRDYYELLERTALTLAVQVSMMADNVPLPDAVSATPLR